MAWTYLLLAGLFEIGWAIMLKYTHGFTRAVPSLLTVLLLAVSMILLAQAARTIPIGTAYAVWTGIGAAGAAVLGIILFNEPRTAARIFFLSLLVVSIVGLKVSA
jgi:quaternary ammonium compound-resistance protein SugE